jgi:hypothetical protein
VVPFHILGYDFNYVEQCNVVESDSYVIMSGGSLHNKKGTCFEICYVQSYDADERMLKLHPITLDLGKSSLFMK